MRFINLLNLKNKPCVKQAIAEKGELTLGRVVATPGAIGALERNNQSHMEFIGRHRKGDWGDIPDDDKKLNDSAMENNDERVLSSYQLKDGTKIWIVTEWDRSVTTILLPDEY